MKAKKILFLILASALCLGLLPALGVPAAAAETLADRQQALVAVAFAYYDKGQSVQYDGENIVEKISRYDGGKTRSTNQEAPEFATPHETLYTVCSDFAHQVYWEAFRYQLCGSAGRCWTEALAKPSASYVPATDPRLIYRYSYTDHALDNMPEDKVAEYGQPASDNAAVDKLLELAEPGDVITTLGASGGHTVVYVGEVKGDGKKYILHSYGRGISETTGIDTLEVPYPAPADTATRKFKAYSDAKGGSIRLTEAGSFLKGTGGTGNAGNRTRVTLIRPLNSISAEDYPITGATKFRMLRPRLSVDRVIEEKTRFTSAVPGEELTLTVTLTNSSDKGYALPVKETIPAGVELVRDPVSEEEGAPTTPRILGGGSERDGVVSWNVRLEAGESKTIGYVCRVTAPRGTQIVFDGGSVGSNGAGIIPSNSIPITVGGAKLTEEDKTKLLSVADGGYADILAAAESATLGQTVYENILGRYFDLPTLKQVRDGATKRTRVGSYYVYVFQDAAAIAEENLWIYRLLVPTFHCGLRVWNEWGHERCIDPRDMHLEPGDLIYTTDNLTVTEPAQDVMVYLGNGHYLKKTDEGVQIAEEPEFVKCMIKSGWFVVRPTLAYDTLPDEPPVPPEPPVVPEPTLTVGSAVIAPGQTGTVTLKLENNPGITELDLDLCFKGEMKLTGVKQGEALTGLSFQTPDGLGQTTALYWVGKKPDHTDGTLLTLEFSVADGAAEGEYPLELVYYAMLAESGEVKPQLVNGTLRIRKYLPGDISGDGAVNAKDVTVLRRYLAGGYGVTVDEKLADINGDGSANAKDVTVLRRYLAGGYGVVLK